MSRVRRAAAAAGAAVLASAALFGIAAPAQAALPTPVSATTARTYLAALTVAADSHASTYDRTLFPHWSTVSGACNTRETVLKRDGVNVVVDPSTCAATSGSWYSQYDGITEYASSDMDIDHMIPLAEAWRSGAWAWTTSQRQAFANDLTRPQLIAVTDNSNQSKSDQDPATWLPPRTAYRCTYVRAWVQVKYYYNLTVDSAEKSALTSVLNGC
jgi:hypothetical protein